MDSSMRYFGCAVGFAFGLVWMTVGLGGAIVCLLLAGLGYGAVFVAARAQTDGIARLRPTETPAAEGLQLEDLGFADYEPDYSAQHEPADDATSPLAAEADYGWPLEKQEIAHTESR
jgi:hypothetical protein